jgi:MFS transporter, PAT family, beta-lactamase induction signal transducer AmpG
VTASSENYAGVRGILRAFGTPAALTMLFLGFGSGLPFLLVGVTLAIWQREVGFSLTDIGLMSAASWLYLFKFLWAPLLDRYPLPFLGRRRGWLLVSQVGVAFFLAAMALLGPKNAEFLFVLLMIAASFFGATQDIVVDAYRIEIAPPQAQAALAAMSTLGYRIALITAGAGALYLANFFGWRFAYLAMAVLMLLPVVTTFFSVEPRSYSEPQRLNFAEAFTAPFAEFFGRHGTALALALLLFVGLFKFPDQVIGVLAGPFYLDSGFTKVDIANVSKLYGVWIGIFGAFLGGTGVAVIGVRPMLLIAALAVAGSNIAFLLMAQNPGQLWAFYAAITADNVAQGFGGVVLVAFMGTLTHPAHTATQFALLVSLAFLPGKFVSALSGYLVEKLGYSGFFMMSTITVVPALFLLIWLWTRIGNLTKPQTGPVSCD